MTSIFEGQPSKNKAISNENKGHLGSRYIRLNHAPHGTVPVEVMSLDFTAVFDQILTFGQN